MGCSLQRLPLKAKRGGISGNTLAAAGGSAAEEQSKQILLQINKLYTSKLDGLLSPAGEVSPSAGKGKC